ncbi:MAG: hypothetical protein ACRD5L_08485 [Bryobacteraceae bacterium]
MANRAYISAWAKDYSEATKLERLGRFLETAPLAASWPGFTELGVRAVDPAETPIVEWDMRSRPVTAAEVIDLLREQEGADMAYEIGAKWDLWVFDLEAGRWQRAAQPLRIDCYGEDYDVGVAADDGHFLVDIGFEHLFTGHAGLLGTRAKEDALENAVAHSAGLAPEEAQFLRAMAAPDRMREYQERTRENIQIMFRWLREAETQVPLERYRLWSEGEENFEARLDEILAVR